MFSAGFGARTLTTKTNGVNIMETTQNDEEIKENGWNVTKIKVNIWNKNGTENTKALQSLQKYIKILLTRPNYDDFILCENNEIKRIRSGQYTYPVGRLLENIRFYITKHKSWKNGIAEILTINSRILDNPEHNSEDCEKTYCLNVENTINTFFYKVLGKCPAKTYKDFSREEALEIINDNLDRMLNGDFQNKHLWFPKKSWTFLEWFDNYKDPKKKPHLEELFIRGYNYICPRRKLTFEDVEFLMGIDDFREILFYFNQNWKILDYKFVSYDKKFHSSFLSKNPIFLYCYNYNEEKKVFYDVQNERLCNDDNYIPTPYKIENHEITFDKNHIEFLSYSLLLIKEKSDIPDICQGETFSDKTGPFLITKDTKQYLLDKDGNKIWNIAKFDHFEEKQNDELQGHRISQNDVVLTI